MVVKNIIWDFDGVILDSVDKRTLGFAKVLKDEGYSDSEIDWFLTYHINNGGLSRYQKLAYFIKEKLKQHSVHQKVNRISNAYSILMKNELCNKSLLIKETNSFIKENKDLYNMHIVSASENMELNYLCYHLGISNNVISIHGSQIGIHKKDNIRKLVDTFMYDREKTVLIGDSINDYMASKETSINFLGYNIDDALANSKEPIEIFNPDFL